MQNLFSLKGHIALVTGASSGIGAHMAQTLAKAGAKVVVAARRKEKLDDVVSAIKASGGEAFAVAMDVQNSKTITAAFDAIENHFGVVDILLNNAGFGGDFTEVVNTDEANWDAVMGINLKGAWRVAQQTCIRLIAAGKSGSIINTTSIAAHGQAVGLSTYAISKTALLSLTKNLALEMAPHNIRVNAVSPGTFLTEMTAAEFNEDGSNDFAGEIPLGRVGDLKDMDGTFLLLASNAGNYITGVCIPVDGGHLIRSL
ncbi:MAG: SDR family oxidoreductase [Alcanivoracaceae bacterium]|nr:SDR family oxidoreductase [Alcanivoracaceae bacterium]